MRFLVASLLWAALAAPPTFADDGTLRESLRDLEVGDRWVYSDWDAARERAKAAKKPLFVVFRCVP